MESVLTKPLIPSDIDDILNFCSFEIEDRKDDSSDISNSAVYEQSHQPIPQTQAFDSEESSSEASEQGDILGDGELQRPPLSIPPKSFRLVPYAYERALVNRVELNKLEGDGELSADRFSAVFVHDIMMLPGSLANVISKCNSDTFNLIKRMTPAVVSGFRTYIHPETKQPCLVQSPCLIDYVQGMVVLGLKDQEIKRINRHYHDEHRAIRINVELEVLQQDGMICDRLVPSKWTLERCKLWTHSWIWSDPKISDLKDLENSKNWSLEDYLLGTYDED